MHPQQSQPQKQNKQPSNSAGVMKGGNASIPRPHADWQIPDRYDVRHLIGAGSYGHVCEAYDRRDKRVVAIKKIHRVFEDLIDCKRILREIAILNRLKHDNIVKTVDICVPTDSNKFDELYLVLEIADSDFKKLFKTPVYLSELHIKTLLYNLLVGVKYTHSAGIYHRDLKPANCLVNQDCSVKICDFGLARTIETPPEPGRLFTGAKDENEEPDLGGVPHSVNMKRQLTSHVVTRWYRAPELILLQENYTSAIDVWSVGCIFAELLGMMKENVNSYRDRSPIFPGSSCFPLSPDQKHPADYKFHTRGNRDQLNVIFNILGTPSAEDIQCLEKEDARRYIKIFTSREGINLSTKFPGASVDAVNLLKRMLVFNPHKRISIDEALSSPLFKDIRNLQIETTAAQKVRLPFDDWKGMNEPQLRYAFLKEVQRFHPEVQIPQLLETVGYKELS